MFKMLFYWCVSVLLLLVLWCDVVFTTTTTCPDGCQCLPGDGGAGGKVFCMLTGLTSLPLIDPGTEELYMQGHHLGTIPNRAFATVSPNLRTLALEDCGIIELQPGAFAGLRNLTILTLKGNGITNLRQGIFAGIEQVNEINLDSNNLQHIDEFTFDGVKNRVVLNLENNNNLKDINPKAFKGAVISEMRFYNCSLTNEALDSILPLQGQMNVFFLTSNRIPLTIPHTLFRGFFLLTLNLAKNGITDVSFLHHVKADDLSLEYNDIGTLNLSEYPSLSQTRIVRLGHTGSQHIEGSFFQGMSSLKELYLPDNHLTALPESLLSIFSNLELLRLEGNPIHCNCELLWFRKWSDLYADSVVTPPDCVTPEEAPLAKVPEEKFVCKAPSGLELKEKAASADKITLLCSASGDPTPLISWRLPNGQTVITQSPRHSIDAETESIVDAQTAGTYMCTASNVAGNMTREIVVTVDGVSGSGTVSLFHHISMLCIVLLIGLLLDVLVLS